MKTKTILFLMCLILATMSYAQVGFKFKAGGSLANISLDENVNDRLPGKLTYGSKFGFVVGLAAVIPLGGDRFTLQPEILFHQKGYSSTYSSSDESSDYTTTFNYLDVPVMARVNFGNFILSAGPYFALGLGGKYKGTDSYLGQTQEHEGKVKFGERPSNYTGSNAYFNAFDFGFAAGAGVKIKAVVIDLRFGYGLIDLSERNFTDKPTLNRSLQLTVELPLVFKK